MNEREIRVPTADGEMTTFVVHPDAAEPLPVAIVFMDGVGYREQVKANARCFASAGYYCVAPDLYYRAGERMAFDMNRVRTEGMEGEEGRRMMAAVAEVTPERVAADTEALLDSVASDPLAGEGARVCVGYCLGARAALAVAARLAGQFAAAACIHPGALFTDQPDSPHHDLERVRGELYVAFAEIDRSATPESVEQFRQAMDRAGVRGTVDRIVGATHGFAMADLSMYDQTASEQHFETTLALWARGLSSQAHP